MMMANLAAVAGMMLHRQNRIRSRLRTSLAYLVVSYYSYQYSSITD
jgi:uncharacterized membrane protein YdcZ (DUF606 family)